MRVDLVFAVCLFCQLLRKIVGYWHLFGDLISSTYIFFFFPFLYLLSCFISHDISFFFFSVCFGLLRKVFFFALHVLYRLSTSRLCLCSRFVGLAGCLG